MSRDPLRLEVLAAGSGLVLLLGAAIASGDSDGSGLDVFGTGLLLNLGTALLLAGVLVRLQRHIAARLDEAEHATREFEADIVRRVEHIDRRISEVVDRTVTERRVVADGDATSLAVPAAADPMPPLADPGPPSRPASAVEAGGSAQPPMSAQGPAGRSGVQARDDAPVRDSRLAPGSDREDAPAPVHDRRARRTRSPAPASRAAGAAISPFGRDDPGRVRFTAALDALASRPELEAVVGVLQALRPPDGDDRWLCLYVRDVGVVALQAFPVGDGTSVVAGWLGRAVAVNRKGFVSVRDEAHFAWAERPAGEELRYVAAPPRRRAVPERALRQVIVDGLLALGECGPLWRFAGSWPPLRLATPSGWCLSGRGLESPAGDWIADDPHRLWDVPDALDTSDYREAALAARRVLLVEDRMTAALAEVGTRAVAVRRKELLAGDVLEHESAIRRAALLLRQTMSPQEIAWVVDHDDGALLVVNVEALAGAGSRRSTTHRDSFAPPRLRWIVASIASGWDEEREGLDSRSFPFLRWDETIEGWDGEPAVIEERSANLGTAAQALRRRAVRGLRDVLADAGPRLIERPSRGESSRANPRLVGPSFHVAERTHALESLDGRFSLPLETLASASYALPRPAWIPEHDWPLALATAYNLREHSLGRHGSVALDQLADLGRLNPDLR
jgi:hypothetical protein